MSTRLHACDSIGFKINLS